MERLSALSSSCSLALVPVGLAGGETAFLALVVVNFIAFHAIWLVPYFRGNSLSRQSFASRLRVPLILFAVCGMATYAILVSQGRAA
jgi:hypothetical protein